MSQGQGQWGRATHHLAVLVVLGAMARAAELVGGLVPWNDATKVSAHGQESEVLDVVRGGDQVEGLALQSLHQLTVVVLMALHPGLQGHGIAIEHLPQAAHHRHHLPQEARSTRGSNPKPPRRGCRRWSPGRSSSAVGALCVTRSSEVEQQ